MSRRPPNEYESRLHQAALGAPRKELTAKQTESILPDSTQRQNALNFLLGVGLFKGLTSTSGQLVFRAVGKEELAATKGLTGEENLVLSHIKSSGNEGIWTKHLKAKTSLHQTVIDRCLKTLTQKHLIKRVQSVQHITRKIYMLEGIEPSISLTGGPWYTDNELDTEFIQKLTGACYKLISDISFPKRRNNEKLLYPISNAPQYPTAEQIRSSLKKARLTDTELTVEHVEMLLNVLTLDGKIEKVPAFGRALWDPDTIADGEDASDHGSKSKRKRKKRVEDSSDADQPATIRKKKRHVPSEESSSEEEDTSSKKSKKPAKEKGNIKSDMRKVGKKKTRQETTSDSEGPSDNENHTRRKKRKSKNAVSSEESSEPESESESESRRRTKSKSSKRERSSSPLATFLDSVEGGSVYRALREAPTISLGLMETPCGPCPSFEFCKQDGPVNPQECAYYSEWLEAQGVSTDIES
ncbi:RNA polymerase Rpc34 [Crepidotus variabilis]|uniref:RNA polymerase Rpc34 n=1 Tax=Crepidotus variabilis TaxID=179855 RepID=A0A9P6JVD7_9AGAR|nr:RNA polymerase Rpc34 [Crepidotus variabilis]